MHGERPFPMHKDIQQTSYYVSYDVSYSMDLLYQLAKLIIFSI
jgi:hypothetical protein